MIKTLAAALAVALAATAAQAQDAWPSQPIRLVAPFTPGSSSDVTARAVAQKISAALGQQVIVDNKPGANGGIGMQAVARAKPDGYTLVVGTVSSTIVPSIISRSVMFDLFKEFVPVATMANTPLLLTVTQDSSYRSVADVVAAAKAAPKTLTYGRSAGLYRIAMEAFNQQAGIDLLGIPYKGPAEATTELLAGRLSVTPDALGAAARMLHAKRIRALAVLGSARTEALPDVPTMVELGYKEFEFNGWLGVLAPAGTPPAIVQRLHREIAAAVQSPEVRAVYANLGLEPTVLSPQAYRDAMVKDLARYERIAQKAGIEKD
jgi:tripartite-type tricarboxylate transporter receptor subunit TctC